MGVRAGVFVCVTSFLLGTLFTHWIADSLTLWKSPVTDEHIRTAALYYSIIAKGPSWILYVLTAIVILGGATILWSLNDLRAGNIMFDGGSIFLFGTTIIMYINSVLPSLANFLSLHGLRDTIPQSLRIATLELASNNLICSVALTGVLALQAGRSWAERKEEGEDDDEFVLLEPDGAPAEVLAATALPTSVGSLKGRSRGKTPEIGFSEDKVKPLLQARLQA